MRGAQQVFCLPARVKLSFEGPPIGPARGHPAKPVGRAAKLNQSGDGAESRRKPSAEDVGRILASLLRMTDFISGYIRVYQGM